MEGFTRTELVGVLAILVVISGLALYNFQAAGSKARDEQRKASARSVVNALEKYNKDFGRFPPSTLEGKILACGSSDNVTACQWGQDDLRDLTDPGYPSYLDPIPLDPRQGQGISFYYLSNGSDFQIFSHLERRLDPEWSVYIDSLNLSCGEYKCNYGITLSRKTVKKVLELNK